MEVLSVEFLGFVLGLWALQVLIRVPRWRSAVLLAGSLFFLLAYLYGDSPERTATRVTVLTAFVLWGYLGFFVSRGVYDSSAVGKLFFPWLLSYLLYYLFITKTELFSGLFSESLLAHFGFIVGISYVLLRQLHVNIDARGGLIKELDVQTYLLYLFSFHTLLAGPIARYPSFKEEVERREPAQDIDTIIRAVNRISSGLVKKYVIAAVLFDAVASPVSGWGPIRDPYDYIVAFHIFAVYEYLDFSGYMDIMIGIGILIGLHIPENFNRPYLSRNLVDFWTRWHITLAHWIRDYVFNPVTIRLGRVFPGHLLLVGVFAYSLAFTLVGLWHGVSAGFVLWGLSQGIGLGTVKIYDTALRRGLGRKAYKKYQESRILRVLTTLITVEYFILTVGLVLLDLWDKL